VSDTQITCCVPPSAVGALPGDVAVERSACVATLAGGFTYTGSAPVVTLLTPSSTSPTPSQLLLTVDGSGFTPSTVVHVDRQPVPTSWLTATQLVAVIPAGFATSPAGLTIEIADTTLGTAVSNPVTLRVGTQDNDGIITVAPLAFAPAALLTGTLQELTPGAPFTLVLEPGSPTPVTGFPTPVDDYLLAVGSPAMFPLLDGLGVFLAPNPAATSNVCGLFSVNANAPTPTAGLTVTLQAAFADPTTAAGFRLTWPYPLDL